MIRHKNDKLIEASTGSYSYNFDNLTNIIVIRQKSQTSNVTVKESNRWTQSWNCREDRHISCGQNL